MLVTERPFQPSLMFVGKARILPYSGPPERSFTYVGSGLTPKHWTRLEWLARDKHSSLLRTLRKFEKKVLKHWAQMLYDYFRCKALPSSMFAMFFRNYCNQGPML